MNASEDCKVCDITNQDRESEKKSIGGVRIKITEV